MRRASKSGNWLARPAIAVLVAALVAVGLARLVPVQPGRWNLPPGTEAATVISSGAENFGRVTGGTREIAQIRLASGTQAAAIVLSGGPLSPGDTVAVRARVSPMPSPFAYEVIARRH